MSTPPDHETFRNQPKILRVTRLMDHMPHGLRYQATVEMFTSSIKAKLASALAHDVVVMPPFDDTTDVAMPSSRIIISKNLGPGRPIETALQEIDATGRITVRGVTDVDEVWLDDLRLGWASPTANNGAN